MAEITFKDMKDGDILFLNDATSEYSHTGIALFQAASAKMKYKKDVGLDTMTHVGMYDSKDNSIAEASGAAGLRNMPLARKHKGYKFEVYRFNPKNTSEQFEIAEKAITIARELIDQKIEYQKEKSKKDLKVYTTKGGDNYSKQGCYVGGTVKNSSFGKGAKTSLDGMSKAFNDKEGKHFKFYCSNFVVACYQLAEMSVRKCKAEDVKYIQLDYRNVSPKTLHGWVTYHDKDNWIHVGTYTTDSKDPQPDTNLVSPHELTDLTYRKNAKLPGAIKKLVFMLENYHGIPSDKVEERRELLDKIGDAILAALEDKGVNEDRHEGLEEFLYQVNLESVMLR